MKQLFSTGQKWLKTFHVIFASLWLGTAAALTVSRFFIKPRSGEALYGILSALDFIDLWVLVPGAMGVLLTGIIYSSFTKWEWFHHK